MDDTRFEDALEELKAIVSRMEEGDLPLEESLSLFERGVELTKFCSRKLDEAEKKVELLLKSENGLITKEPFEGPAEEENKGADKIGSSKVPQGEKGINRQDA